MCFQQYLSYSDFCGNFDVLYKLFNYINYEFPMCSIITEDFNAPYTRWWWENDITN